MGKKQDMSTLIQMVKELQRQNAVLQNKMLEIQNEFTMERNRRSIEYVRMSQDKQNATTQFRGYSESIETFNPEETRAESKRKAWEKYKTIIRNSVYRIQVTMASVMI
ncbi:uncharacterized protein LOC124442244 [Xenia sp. Carnegie-2017]|uniref:uncharacterized protein LOC124442244 n=1 Tax=Xenia sp. Carnegie-2017 TaxID=2897299 RepID=UPI001F048E1B|nr:uncharacterized protein LOC124442244 [Xenia sp. Carnegie-2017]